MYAYINIVSKAPSKLSPLTIDKNEIGFFIKPVLTSSDLLQTTASSDTWVLTFFKNTPFATTLEVVLSEQQEPDNSPLVTRAKAKAVWFNNEFKSENNERFGSQMSQFLRGSNALSLDKLIATTNAHHLINDRDGLAYFSGNAEQFKRIVLCLALALAYSQVMSQCVDSLTAALKKDKNHTALLSLYEQILFFNASDYFSHPVRLDRHELFTVWKLIRDHWHLDELNSELTSQLTSVASFLQSHRDREELKAREEARQRQREREKEEDLRHRQIADEKRAAEKMAADEKIEAEKRAEALQSRRDRKINYAIGFASLLLTFLSVLSLVQLTPEHFDEAYQNWVAPVIDNMSNTE